MSAVRCPPTGTSASAANTLVQVGDWHDTLNLPQTRSNASIRTPPSLPCRAVPPLWLLRRWGCPLPGSSSGGSSAAPVPNLLTLAWAPVLVPCLHRRRRAPAMQRCA